MALTLRPSKEFEKEIKALKATTEIKSSSKMIEYTVMNFRGLENEIGQLKRDIKTLNNHNQALIDQLSNTHSAIANKIEAENELKKADKALNAIIFSPGELRSGELKLKNDSRSSFCRNAGKPGQRNFDCKKEQESSYA